MKSMYLSICLISIEKKFKFLCLISLPFTAAIKPSNNKIVHFVFHCVAAMKTLQFPGFISLSDGKLNNTVLLASNWLWDMVSGWIDFSRWTQMWCLSSWIKRFFSRFTTTLPSIKLIWNTFLKLEYMIQKKCYTQHEERILVALKKKMETFFVTIGKVKTIFEMIFDWLCHLFALHFNCTLTIIDAIIENIRRHC